MPRAPSTQCFRRDAAAHGCEGDTQCAAFPHTHASLAATPKGAPAFRSVQPLLLHGDSGAAFAFEGARRPTFAPFSAHARNRLIFSHLAELEASRGCVALESADADGCSDQRSFTVRCLRKGSSDAQDPFIILTFQFAVEFPFRAPILTAAMRGSGEALDGSVVANATCFVEPHWNPSTSLLAHIEMCCAALEAPSAPLRCPSPTGG